MRRLKNLVWCSALLTCAFAVSAHAASSLSNSLTGFTGDTSQAATQTALTAAGLEAADTTAGPIVVFGANGAGYGTTVPSDGGRNYLRTIESYALNSYTAEVTAHVQGLKEQQVFFGMGGGNITVWGVPDIWGEPTMMMTPEVHTLNTNGVDGNGGWTNPVPPCASTGDWCHVNDVGGDYAATGHVDAASYVYWRNTLGNVAGADPAQDMAANGDDTGASQDIIDAADHAFWKSKYGAETFGNIPYTIRLKSTYDFATKKWQGAIDYHYTGGPFHADFTTAEYNLTDMYEGGFTLPTNGGWSLDPMVAKDPSKIYFGGDDGVIFSDLAITVTPGSGLGAGSAVPEPCMALLVACALSGGVLFSRRR